MTRRLFGKLLTSAALGTLCSIIIIRPIRQSKAGEQIVVYKGWVLKTSDFER
ncbi:MAG: hypothetical protein ACR2RF_04560 [Geminicoccaceae bacterium]